MSNSKKSKKQTILFTLLIVVLLIFIVFASIYTIYKASNKMKAQMTMLTGGGALPTEAATQSDIDSVVSTTGTVETQKEYTVSVTTTQEISKVLVDVGDPVAQDQVLIEYDFVTSRKTLDKNLEDAKISLTTAELSLASLNLPATKSEIDALKNAIVASEKTLYLAQMDLDNNTKKITETEKNINSAQIDLDNSKKLYDIGAISKDEYDKATTAYENLATSLSDIGPNKKAMEYTLSMAQYGLNKAHTDLSTAQKSTRTAADEIRYKQQQLQVDSSKLRIKDIQSQINDLKDVSTSPVAGVVIAKNVEDGDIATQSKDLIKIADVTKLVVSTTITEYDASKVLLGQLVTMTSDGILDKVYNGKITFIDPVAKKVGSDTVVPIEVSIENSDAFLKPGFTVDLEILTASAKNVLCVPTGSIVTDKDHNKFVFVLTNENKLVKKIIKTGVYGDMYVEVKDGLIEGDLIVSIPDAEMEDGQTIDPLTGKAIIPEKTKDKTIEDEETTGETTVETSTSVK